MFHKTIEAVRAAQAAAQEELDALWVPYDPASGNGGLHWHAAGSGILQNAIRGLAGLAEELEKRQGPIDEADAAAKQTEADAAKADEEARAREQLAELERVEQTEVTPVAETPTPTPVPAQEEPLVEPEPEPVAVVGTVPEAEVTPSA